MDKIDIYQYIMLGIIGLALGVFFFTGSRLTIRVMQKSPAPVFIMLVSMLARFSIVGASLWYASQQNVARMAALTIGLVIARFITIRNPGYAE